MEHMGVKLLEIEGVDYSVRTQFYLACFYSSVGADCGSRCWDRSLAYRRGKRRKPQQSGAAEQG